MMPFIDADERLRKACRVLDRARRKAPHYRRACRELGEVETWEEWLKVPFLTRDVLYNHTWPRSSELLTCEVESMLVTSTGGSSGMARYGLLTYDEWDAFVTVQAEALRLLGVERRDLVANLFVAGSLWPSFFALHEIIKTIGAVHLPISANIDIDRILEFIIEFRPTVLLSLPTVFVFLADKILERGLNLDHVRLIGFAGEHLSDNIRAHLHRAFGDQVQISALAYTSADCGLMGYQCRHCGPKVYHLPTDFQFIEIHDLERDCPCAAGETGEVVVTNLARFSFPVIRYLIGDLARWLPEPCPCGDPNPLFSLEGRAGADFKLGGAYIAMGQVEKALSPVISRDGISATFQLELEDLADNLLQVRLLVESSNPERSAVHVEEIKERLRREISEIEKGEELNYVVLKVEFIELGSLERSPITGKVQHLHDKRVEE